MNRMKQGDKEISYIVTVLNLPPQRRRRYTETISNKNILREEFRLLSGYCVYKEGMQPFVPRHFHMSYRNTHGMFKVRYR
jgi:hypothetical protein